MNEETLTMNIILTFAVIVVVAILSYIDAAIGPWVTAAATMATMVNVLFGAIYLYQIAVELRKLVQLLSGDDAHPRPELHGTLTRLKSILRELGPR